MRPATGLIAGGALALAGVALATPAVVAPIPMTTFGLAIFGIVHVAMELRYVVGRFRSRIDAVVGWSLLFILTLVAGARGVAALVPSVGRAAEIVLGVFILGVGVWLVGWRRVGLAVVALVGVVSLLWPQWYFHVITHLHNLVPLAFLWDWGRRRLPTRGARVAFLAGNAVWVLVIPLAIVLGAVDGWISVDPGAAAGWVGDGARVIAASAPPGADPLLGARFLAAFAFLQSMHYVVWIGFFPLAGRAETSEFGRLIPWLRGWRLPTLAVGLGAAGLAVFLADYGLGRFVYGMVASYHVYVEFPLLVLLFARRASAGLPSPDDATPGPDVADPGGTSLPRQV